MTPADMRSWRKSLGLSQEAAADAMGLARRTVQGYEAGENPIPPHIALACAALFYRLPPWSNTERT